MVEIFTHVLKALSAQNRFLNLF